MNTYTRCPFCGSSNIGVQFWVRLFKFGWRCSCRLCKARGPEARSKVKAIERWNVKIDAQVELGVWTITRTPSNNIRIRHNNGWHCTVSLKSQDLRSKMIYALADEVIWGDPEGSL